MQLPTKILERKLLAKGKDYIIGVDEVGVGALAGPVVACAVMLEKKFFERSYRGLNDIRDSKLLTVLQRKRLAAELEGAGMVYSLGLCRPKTIDRINIYQATRLAMRRAICKMALSQRGCPIVLIDGKMGIEDLPMEQRAIIGGDRKVFAIACASIIAKVYRDRLMINYARHYPQYGFEKHKGYGTKFHRTQLTRLGPCKLHRRSFAPVAKLL